MTENMSKNELIDAIEVLQDELEELTNEITDLTKKNIKLKNKLKLNNINDDIDDENESENDKDSSVGMNDMLQNAALETENNELREKLLKLQNENNTLKEKNLDLQSHNKVLQSEKIESDADLRNLRKKIDELEKSLSENEESMRASLRKSQDINKQKKDTQKQQLQLYEENETLQKENKSLYEQNSSLLANIDVLEKLIAQLADDKDALEIERNGFQFTKEECERRIQELERDLEIAEEKLQVAHDTDSQWEDELTRLQHEHQIESDKFLQDIDKLTRQLHILEKENTILKDSTLVGEKQREIDILKKKLKETSNLVEEMRIELEASNNEKKQLADRLITYDETFEERFADRMSKEKENSRVLQKKLEAFLLHQHDEEQLRLEVEAKYNELSKEADSLRNWKIIYENGHGLQELAKHQKKMKEDKRRVEITLETVSTKLSETIEAKALVEQAFMKLKEETGRDINFEYPEYILEKEMKGENSKLRLQVTELEEQIDSLEKESIRLRRALANQAAMVGEQGFKYAGMSPDLLVKVNEFATNLRDGRIDLPLDDRSAILMKENRKLKEDIKILTTKVERYESELGGNTGQLSQQLMEMMSQVSGNRVTDEAYAELRNDFQNLVRVNEGLQNSLSKMQNEILSLLKQHIGKPNGITEDLEAMILASNEVIMKEMQDIRSVAASRQQVAPSKSSNVNDTFSIKDGDDNSVSGHSIIDGKPPLGNNKTKPFNSKLTIDTPDSMTTPRGKPPLGASLQQNQLHQQGTPYGNRSQFQMSGGYFTPGGQYSMQSPGGYVSLQPPATPQGQSLLQKTLANMNLPAEDWVDELKELNGQLIESLEQLFERETELQQQKEIISNLEGYLVEMKQQMTALYVDYTNRANEWENKEKELKKELKSMIYERDDIQLKLRRVEETVDLLNSYDKNNTEENIVQKLENKLKSFLRKITIYEVNEAVLTRKYHTLSEQFENEHNIRKQIENDFVEMETLLKKRILFLEQYKSQTKNRIEYFQKQLELSVPQSDYILLTNELERLREDYLFSLRRELESRIDSLNSVEVEREARTLKSKVIQLEAEIIYAKQSWHNIAVELENQKDITQRTIVSFNNSNNNNGGVGNNNNNNNNQFSGQISSKDYGILVSEMARYRGDASRLEVELITSNQRCDLLEIRIREMSNQIDASLTKIKELEQRNEISEKNERSLKKDLSDLKIQYQGAILGSDAELLKNELKEAKNKINELELSNNHLKEITEIATQQTETIHNFKDIYEDELKMMKEMMITNESRTDDDLIIGRLQRQLIGMKISYKTFYKKYNLLRNNMRQREIQQRILEERLDSREELITKLNENYNYEINLLKNIIKKIYENILSENLINYSKNNIKSANENNNMSNNNMNNKQKIEKDEMNNYSTNMSFEEKSLKLILKQFLIQNKNNHSNNNMINNNNNKISEKTESELNSLSLFSLSDKFISISSSVNYLVNYFKKLNQNFEINEENKSKLELENEKLKEENLILLKSLKDYHEVNLNENNTISNNLSNKQQMSQHSQQQAKKITLKVFELNNEIKSLKLLSIQQKREISHLQNEKKNLTSLLNKVENSLQMLEEEKLNYNPEINSLNINEFEEMSLNYFMKLKDELFNNNKNNNNNNDDNNGNNNNNNNNPFDLIPNEINNNNNNNNNNINNNQKKSKKISPIRPGVKLSINTDENEIELSDNEITKEELLDKIEKITSEKLSYQNEVNNLKRQIDSQHNKFLDLQEVITSQEEQISYYERMAASEGLPIIKERLTDINDYNNGYNGNNRNNSMIPRGKEWRMMREEQEKLQEAASATIGSMRTLLEEKNLEIERMQAKIDSMKEGNVSVSGGYRRGQMSVADKRAEDLLKRLEDEDRYKRNGNYYNDNDDARNKADKSLVQRLMDQIDHADEILQEKIKAINQYEQKLSLLMNQKEKAEQRCGIALDEMEAMKSDLATLVQQLQEKDDRYAQLTKYQELVQNEMNDKLKPNGSNIISNNENIEADMTPLIKIRELKRKNLELHKMVSSRDEKVKQYRTIIVNLKEEFIKSEEEKALLELNVKAASESKPAIDSYEIEQLKSQISALRDGLKQAKEDVDAARKGREKLVKAREAAQEETERLETQVARAEAQASAAQEALQRTRRDLEESKRREVRLREKIKEIEENLGEDSKGRNPVLLQEGIERLRKELEITKSENASLRKSLGIPNNNVPATTTTASRGRTLLDDGVEDEVESKSNRNAVVVPGSMDELRQQLHSKWESEKKLQKRSSTLEKRLQEKVEELEDCQAQLRKQKELTQQFQTMANREKERADRVTKFSKPSKQQQSESVLELHGLEELQTRIFDLEEENETLRRKANVQLPNEITTLKYQNQTLMSRINEVERDLEESEMRRKQLSSATREGAGGFGSSLRASEDRYLREEILRDELNAARRIKLELEANLLERDSKAMENRFELDAKESEINRLKRRVRELESITRSASGNNINNIRNESPNIRSASASRLNQDKDTEVVVESLRKVIDKLKSENERLRRGIGTTGENKSTDVEKRLTAERKKTEKLEEDIKVLTNKLKVFEDGGQKLVQKQQQIAGLRKQLKTREDTIAEQVTRISELQTEMSNLQKAISDSQLKIQQLELQVASKTSNRPSTTPNQERANLSELTDLRRKSAQQLIENESLKTQLTDLRREITQLRSNNNNNNIGGGGGNISSNEIKSLKDQISQLTIENTRLKNELSAFDLDFFEEIENLKYSHAEALRKLKTMEKMYGPIR